MITPPNSQVTELKVGTILYIQDGVSPFSGVRWLTLQREPWQVLAWTNRECDGRYLRGGHLAVVKSLRTGQIKKCADWILKACVEAGLDFCKGETRAIKMGRKQSRGPGRRWEEAKSILGHRVH